MNNILVHKHLIVRAEAKNPPMDEAVLTEWFKKFIEEIGMKAMMGPYVKYSHMIGNRGITGAAIIETSHIVMHVWDEPDPALLQFDVYSCGEDSIVEYYGKTESEIRQESIEKFQDPRSPVRFFVGNPQTGGYGITLTAASTVIYYSNGYDLEKRLQSEDRAHRIGQKKSVTYIDLIAEKTVDEKIVKALRKKINIASEVLGEELRDWI